MSLPKDYLEYPLRRYGMDHERYDWSMLPQRAGVAWPGGARIALWVVPALEWFPLDMKGQPFKPPGAMQTAYPDFRHYTLRDYGNRVGIYRIMQALERHGIRATAAVNAAVAVRYPHLIQACRKRGWEIVAKGLDMDHLHHGGLSVDEERAWIAQALGILNDATGQKVRGWLSPAKSESFQTLDLLAEAGLDYVCDWVNDDMPYALRTSHGPLHAMPHPIDIDDHTILVQNHHTEDDFRDALIDQFDLLYREATPDNGRVMAIALHPWVIGQPYRIGALEQALAHIMSHTGVWTATGSEILDAWKSGGA
ncbi:polysaccharide deacetylase family protein [Hydrogenophaga sp. OTU3427]|uniref:polysaccharide deacetylase family protein n=1 Tax=Hydrogenophaga sp. OTU3427 TaxID=3043856 RepID=UPI00313EBAFD